MKMRQWVVAGVGVVIALGFGLGWVFAEGSIQRETASSAVILGDAFTYQGYLTDADDEPIDGVQCDLSFGLWDAVTGGTQLGITQTVPTMMQEGYFDVLLNGGGEFGVDAFDGRTRFLSIGVQCPDDAVETSLGRTALHAAPYALFAKRVPMAGSGVAQTVARSDHHHDSRYQALYRRTVVVSPVGAGGNPQANGAALLSAMDTITGTLSQRYLVKIEPGIYDIVTATLKMKPYVDIEGSGKLTTVIGGEGRADFDDGTVLGADHAEIRSLTVGNYGGDDQAIAINNQGTSGFSITNVVIKPSGGSINTVGILNTGEDLTISDVTILLEDDTYGGRGFYNYTDGADATAMLSDVVIEGRSTGSVNFIGLHNAGDTGGTYVGKLTADSVRVTLVSGGGYTYGLQNTHAAESVLTNCELSATTSGNPSRAIYVSANASAGTVSVDHSKLIGKGTPSYAVQINGASSHRVSVGASMVDGMMDAGSGGTIVCIGSYDGDYLNTNGFTLCP